MTDRVVDRQEVAETDIAIVGMAAHLPGAATIVDYWENLRAGVESIRHLSETELLENGESPARMRHRNYVPAAAILDKFDHFDADFFGFSAGFAGGAAFFCELSLLADLLTASFFGGGFAFGAAVVAGFTLAGAGFAFFSVALFVLFEVLLRLFF